MTSRICEHKHTTRIPIALICTDCKQVIKNTVSPKKPKVEHNEQLSPMKYQPTFNYSISSTVLQNIHENLKHVYSIPILTNITPPDTQINDDILHIFSKIPTQSRAKTTSTYAFYLMTVIIHTICQQQPLNFVDVSNYICKKHKGQVKSFKYNMQIILKYSKYYSYESFYKSIIIFITKTYNMENIPHTSIDKWTKQILHFEKSFINIRESIGQKKISINTFKLMTSYIPIYIFQQVYGDISIHQKYLNLFIVNKGSATIIRNKSDLNKVLKSS